MKKSHAKSTKTYHIPIKLLPLIPTVLKISAKNVITDLKIKVSIIKGPKIFMVRGFLPLHIYLSDFK